MRRRMAYEMKRKMKVSRLELRKSELMPRALIWSLSVIF
jgi:hypothetical protein